jgi:hypothetical protein
MDPLDDVGNGILAKETWLQNYALSGVQYFDDGIRGLPAVFARYSFVPSCQLSGDSLSETRTTKNPEELAGLSSYWC